jgi:magnesium transporter
MDNKKYKKDSAGSLMIKNVPVFKDNFKVSEMKDFLNNNIKDLSTINYIYIISQEDKLIGAISIKNLFGYSSETMAKDLISSELISVSANTDKERVAMLALEKNLKAIPVVDDNGLLLGIIPNDIILKILYDESMENLLHLGGAFHKEPYETNIFSFSLLKSLKTRLPWLIVGLFGGLFSAFVVSNFEEVLNKNIILASFIPLVVYMSAAVGSQMQAFIIRDLALNHNLNFFKYLIKHTQVVFFIALIISFLLCLLINFIYGEYLIGVVLAVSLFFAIITSIITGLIIPFIFYKFKLDPANASGPIATNIQDILSILVYFLTAYIIL